MQDFLNNDEVEKLITRINKDLKEVLSEKRYNHSIGVMKKAEELAKIHGENINKTKLVGLAHDIGKELSENEMIQYTKENNIEVDEIEKINIGLLHAKIGADICYKKYGFSIDMQNAIKYHTVGNLNMDLLSKIIFVADKIEDGRNYKDEDKSKDLKLAREIAITNIDKALLFEIDCSIKYTIQKGKLIHPDSILIRNKLLINKDF